MTNGAIGLLIAAAIIGQHIFWTESAHPMLRTIFGFLSSIATLIAGLAILLALSGCTANELTAACQVDAAVQPVLVTLAPELLPELAPLAATDAALVHPAVVAACAVVGGKPVAVTAQ